MARLLALPPLVGVGLISYSLYLWHWPLIVFTEYATDAPLSGGTRILVIAAALAAAILSWRFVERPFRDSRRLPARAIFRFTGVAMALLCTLSLALMAMGGWPARFAPQVLAQMAGQADFAPTRKQCHDSFMRGAKPCILGADVPPDAMLWGDSHGVELAYALSVRAKAQGRSLIERTTSSCPPVLGYEAKDPRCAAANRAAFDAIRADPGIRRVYLAAFWANGDFDRPAFVAQLDRTIAALRAQGRQVVLIGPVPPQPIWPIWHRPDGWIRRRAWHAPLWSSARRICAPPSPAGTGWAYHWSIRSPRYAIRSIARSNATASRSISIPII
jgi:hypothetical protein